MEEKKKGNKIKRKNSKRKIMITKKKERRHKE